jgi:SAM-dependent methyltransferase
MDQSAWAPHGAAMRAFHQGKRDATIVVYDDYERDEVPIAYFFREPAEFPPAERLALDLCRGRVLDVGAGSGCHTLALQARGLQVTAVEALPELVEILRDRGARDARLTTWADLVARPYDTVLVLMNGFGLAETLSGLPRFLRKMRRLVRPDGQLIADSTDVRVRMDPEAGRTGSLVRADGRYIGELHFQLEFEGRKGAPFAQLYVDPERLGRHADETGWKTEIVSAPDEYGHYLARLTRRVRRLA